MNIAMFTDAYYPRVNGVAVSVKSYAESLVKFGHKVFIVCCDYNENSFASFATATIRYEYPLEGNKDFVVLRVPAGDIIFSKEDKSARINQWWNIKHALDALAPDVVHVNSEFVMGWYGVTYARHRHKAIVFTFHTLWEDYFENYIKAVPAAFSQKLGREVVKFYLKRADEIIVPTKRIADVMQRYKIERSADILPTGIPEEIVSYDEENFKSWKEKILAEFPVLDGADILLYVGRVVKEKNIDFLYDVLTRVRKTNPKAVLLIVGGGPWLSGLKELAKKSGLEDSIVFTDYRPREELVNFYHIAKVFTFPSVTETQGLVTVEAMMSGLPVVAIGEMGTYDVMQGDNGGFMVNRDSELFAQKVLDLLNDGSLHEKKSAEAVAWGKKWSMNTLTPKLIEFYEKAIKEKALRQH